jgi:uncharacterized protein DUF4236/SH3 domain-containing protein
VGLRFRRSLRIAPGLRINLGSRVFTSISVGGRGATLNVGKRGVLGTFSLPGTGLSYQHRFGRAPGPGPYAPQDQRQPAVPPNGTRPGNSIRPFAYLAIALLLFSGYIASRLPSREPVRTDQARSASVSGGSHDTAAPPAASTAGIAPNGNIAQRPAGPDTTTSEVGRPEVKKTITATQAVNVRALPSMSGAVVRVLPKGAAVQVLEAQNGWLRVGESDGTSLGWVHHWLLK